MSKIDYQKLREIAEKTKIAGEAPVMPFDQRINALNDFMKHFSPDIALALLDERERNLQYIKSRDQENEDIALTVGKLRVELEAAENNLIDSECHVAELEEALRDKQALLEASEKRIAELEAEPVRQAYKLNELSGNSPVTPDGWISCSERMPAQDDWILIYSKHGEYMAGQVQGEYVELSDGTLSWLGNALFWMRLPEPPQEVNRG
ncbi:TPA: ead/Ea22-like family protein [Salmonella enterica subsp. enterica serovar Typhimurium]|nr:ead/Ea22-like family protein [Salmonella enterica subsp. enterica serovar Typhimurium]